MSEPFTWAEGNQVIAEIGSDRWLAERIREERQKRKWSQADLAERLTEVGAPLHQTAISRIEKGVGDRRVSVAEAIGFAKAFGVPFGELLLPSTVLRTQEVWRQLMITADLRSSLRSDSARYTLEVGRLRSLLTEHPDAIKTLAQLRLEVMNLVDVKVREVFDQNNQDRLLLNKIPRRWNPGNVEASRPPLVILIDVLLDGAEDPMLDPVVSSGRIVEGKQQ